MRYVQFTNNSSSLLAANLSAVATSLSMTPGDGSKFPALSAGQYFKATLVRQSDGALEVVKVTARSSDTLTIERAAEAIGGVATALAFVAGDKIELRMTAGVLADELDRLDSAAYIGPLNKTSAYTVVEADASSLVRVDTTAGAITITLPQISTLTQDFHVLISKITGDANNVSIARAGSDTINGNTTYSLTTQWHGAWLIADRSTSTWTVISSGAGGVSVVTDAFTGSGTAGPFTLSGDPGVKNNTAVYVGGVYQQKSTYTLSGTSLTLGGTVASGVSIEVVWSTPQVISIGTPTDGTVTTAKIVDGAVTYAKTSGIAPRATRIDVASVAGTVDLTTNAPNTDDIRITGALTITGFTVAVGRVVRVTAGGAHTLTNNANIVTNTGANIVCAAGNTYSLRATAANTVEVFGFSNVATVPDASTTVKGIVELATAAETIAGTDATKSVTPQSAAGLLPCALGNFDGTGTPTYRHSVGMNTSITDNGTGNYTVAFSSALPNTNYVVITGVGRSGGADGTIVEANTFTTGGFTIITNTDTGANVDADYIHFAVFKA